VRISLIRLAVRAHSGPPRYCTPSTATVHCSTSSPVGDVEGTRVGPGVVGTELGTDDGMDDGVLVGVADGMADGIGLKPNVVVKRTRAYTY